MWRQAGRFATWQHSGWAIIMELGRGPLHGGILYQAKNKRIYESSVEQFFIDFLAGFCLRRAISHLVLQVGMESAQCEQCGQVFVYICVHVCACIYSVIFLIQALVNKTSQLRIKEITLHSV